MVANIWPMNPAGVQAIRPIRPPDRVTRTSSSAAGWWCGANITPTQEVVTSKVSSAYGNASASPVSQTISNPSAGDSRRPVSTSSGVRSDAVTRAPARAAGRATLPDPAATSSSRSPDSTPTASTRVGPRPAITSVATAG